jgi:hypothetical protein
MAKRDMQDGWGFLGDILRESSWPVRLSLVFGLGTAVIIWIGLLTSGTFTIDDMGRSGRRFGVLAACGAGLGLLFAGGIGGLLLGGLVEMILGPLKKPTDSRGRRRRRPRRDEEDDF